MDVNAKKRIPDTRKMLTISSVALTTIAPGTWQIPMPPKLSSASVSAKSTKMAR